MKTERELYIEKLGGFGVISAQFNNINECIGFDCFDYCALTNDDITFGFRIWLASKNREGYKLVPVSDISEFYQDDVEPEIFCERESDFDNLGDCTELNEIMTVNKYTSARLKKETLYGVWCKCERKAPYFKGTEFKLFSNKDDAKKAMIGAADE